MTDRTRERIRIVSLVSGVGWFLSFLVLVIGTEIDLLAFAIMILTIIFIISTFLEHSAGPTQTERVRDLRNKVFWGLWAEGQLQKLGIDPLTGKKRPAQPRD